jgi:hypothetical protein
VRHLPARDLEAEERLLPLLSVLKSAFLRMEEFDKYAVAVSKARRSGKLAHVSQIDRPRPVQLQAALHCLVVLASRAPTLVQSVYPVVDEYARHFVDDRAMAEKLQSLRYRVYSLKSATLSDQSSPSCTTHLASASELLEVPFMSRDDDALLVAIARAVSRSSPLCCAPTSSYETITGESDMLAISVAHRTNPTIRRLTLFVRVTNATALAIAGGMIYLLTPEHVRPWREDAPQFAESILRTEPHGTRQLTLTTMITRFAPVRIVFRIAVSVPKPEPEEEEEQQPKKTRPAGSATTPTPATAGPTLGKPRTPSSTSRDTNESEAEAEEAELWPDIYTEPHDIDPFELVDPLPLSQAQFAAVWPRMPASVVDDYSVPAASGLRADMLASRLAGLPMSLVASRWWGSGTCFELSYAFVSWFDDVFGLVVTGRQSAKTLAVRLQWRSSSALALTNLHSVMPHIVSVFLANSATTMPEDDPSNTLFSTCETPCVAINEKLHLTRWHELSTTKAV